MGSSHGEGSRSLDSHNRHSRDARDWDYEYYDRGWDRDRERRQSQEDYSGYKRSTDRSHGRESPSRKRFRPSDNGRSKRGRRGERSWRDKRRIFDGPMKDLGYFERDYDPSTAKRMYEEYKDEYEKRQTQSFYEIHRDDKWFLEEYEPNLLADAHEVLFTTCRDLATSFVAQHATENEASVQLDLNASLSPLDPHGLTETISVPAIPVYVSRGHIEKALEALGEECTVVRLTLTRVDPDACFYRTAKITFPSKEQAARAAQELQGKVLEEAGFTLTGVVHLTNGQKYRIPARLAPAQSRQLERMKNDLMIAGELRELFDDHKGIEEAEPFFDACSHRTDQRRLDLLIEYLREIHSYCYYCGKAYRDRDEMYLECGLSHHRADPASSAPSSSEETVAPSSSEPTPDRNPSTDSTTAPETSQGETDAPSSSSSIPQEDPLTWGEALDKQNRAYLKQRDEYAFLSGESALHKQTEEFLFQNAQSEGENYRCALCGKLFRGREFINQHLESKHENEMADVESKVMRKQFYLNFEDDSHRFALMVPDHRRYSFRAQRASRDRPVAHEAPADPRALRDYVDLDAPMKPAAVPDYRAQVTYDDV